MTPPTPEPVPIDEAATAAAKPQRRQKRRWKLHSKFLNPGEEIVFSEREHVKALFVPIIILFLTVGLSGYLSGLLADQRAFLIVVWAIAAAIVAVFVVWPFLQWRAATFTVTNQRLTTHAGVITKRGHDIPLSRISDVRYERDLIDRIFRCGTLIISDASTKGQVKLRDIPRVAKHQRALSEALHAARTAGRNDGY